MAQFFKARAYLISVQPSSGNSNNVSKELVRRDWFRSINFFIRALNDGLAFEGGVELLMPPIGFAYYHLWELLEIKAGFDKEERDEIQVIIDADREFQGDKARFLDIKHCRARAYRLLETMIGRHTEGHKAYFDYVESRYYLEDDFADPNFQASWACEYALIPVAEKMLETLRASK